MLQLFQLPNEVLAIIFAGLDANAFFALRLTCRHAQSATLLAFTNRYFQTRYMMLSRLSLENLVMIGRHPTFGPAVTRVEVCTDHFVRFPDIGFNFARHEGDMLLAIQEGRCQSTGEEGLGTDQDIVSSQASEEMTVDKAAYQLLWEEQEHLITSGLVQAYLTKGLMTLPNIEAAAISNRHRPWGALVHERQIGLPPTNILDDFEDIPFVSQVLRITLTAIATSGAALSSFALMAGFPREAITPDIIRPSEAYIQYYGNISASLKELTLNISPTAKSDADDQWTDDLLAFIHIFSQLTHLDLIIGPIEFGPRVNRLRHLMPRLQLPSLQHFGLYNTCCSVQDLGVFIVRRKATLQGLHLFRIAVSGGVDHWKSLFALIRAHHPSFELYINEEGKERFEDDFQAGGSHEEWTRAIEAIVAR
ncbi:hypothetical protein B0I35DRAFT_441885 [Stachybotrys elegans]|uniref:F-box domain-containing protein n=1 Tax=Stachybotrys elegans TaxID=80388 RepID=A0A8K0SG45_9HYPO|nr:hypothetical protein B0I35DRAFT_441885 [Stachybotrys elegans]